MQKLILLLAETTGKINWTDEVFKKWIASGNEAYLFLILVVLSLLAIISALLFLFKLYINEKDAKYKALAEMEKSVEKEKEKIRSENKLEINKWIDKWGSDKENYSKELVIAIKRTYQALDDIYNELEVWKGLFRNKCEGGKESDFNK